MNLLEVMQSRLGVQELPGNRHNPVIVGWAADAGHPEISDDETSWCSLSLCSAAKEAGLPFPPVNVNALARSWLTWGVAVDPANVKPGDVAIWPRGNSTWQGHVNVVEEVLMNGRVVCIGGNQSGLSGGDAVTRARPRPMKEALGFRRAVLATVEALRKAGSSEVKQADRIQNAGWFSLLLSSVVATIEKLMAPVQVPQFTSLPESLTFWQQVLGGVNAVGALVLAHPFIAGCAVFTIVAWLVGRVLKTKRLEKHAAGVPLSSQVGGA